MLMLRKIGTAGVLAAALLVTGCGGDTHESVMQESLAEMRKMVDTMKKVTDKSSATAQADTFKAIGEKMKTLKERADKLPKLSSEEEKALETKFKGEMEPIMKDMISESFRVMALGPEVQAQLQSAMQAMDGL